MGIARFFSALLFKHPRALFFIQSSVLRLIWRLLDIESALWVVRRPNWLRRARGEAIPLAPSQPGSALGDAEIERIRSAYAAPVSQLAAPVDDIWGSLRETHLVPIVDALQDPQSAKLRSVAENIFSASVVNGFSYGTTFDRWPHRWRYLPLQIELSAVTLAESLGALRLENPEQGSIAGWRDQLSPEELVDAIESRLGFRIDHPRSGNPKGIMFGGRFLARETCSQIYTASRIASRLSQAGLTDTINVVEIGGGYGGLSYWLWKLLGAKVGRYAIVDLREVSAIQAIFLLQNLDAELSLPSEDDRTSKFQLVINDRLDELAFKPDLIINQDSMPEMPLAVVDDYLDWIANSGASLFASFNHEANAPNSPREAQGWISHMAGGRPEFTRLSRELSWDRPGYIEEIYRIAAIPGQGAGPV